MATSIGNFKKDFDWEDKAQTNPLYAIMSDSVFENSGIEPTQEELTALYRQGEKFWNKWFAPLFWNRSDTRDLVLLEYGCGMGRIISYPAPDFAKCYGVDISETQIEFANRYCPNMDKIIFSVLNKQNLSIPIENDTADVVYSYAVLQHIQKRSALVMAVSEMARVLKKAGKLKIQVRTTHEYLSNGKRSAYFSGVFEDYTFAFYLRKLTFLWMPVFRVFRHTNWSGAGCFFSIRQFRLLLMENSIKVDSIEFDVGHNVVWFEGSKI